MQTEAPYLLGYRPALDGVRAAAVLLVMWHHTFVVLLPWSRGSLSGGFIGVDVFFVLSGFLITSLIVERTRQGSFTFGGFYRRRALRLLPALFAFLAAHIFISLGLHNNMHAELRSLVGAVTYTSNWAPAVHIRLQPDLIHLWSLAIEEQFYLLWPFLLILLLRRRPRTLFLVLSAMVGVVVLWRIALLHHYGVGFPIIYQRTDARADALLVGALVALGLHSGWRPSARLRRGAGWLGLAVLLACTLLGRDSEVGRAGSFFAPSRILYDGGFTLVAMAAAGLILAGLDGPGALQRLLARRPLVAIGRASYSLYLWHVVVFELVSLLIRGSGPARIAVAWPAALAIAALSRRFIELPFLARGGGQAGDARPWASTPRATVAAALATTVGFALAGYSVAAAGHRSVAAKPAALSAIGREHRIAVRFQERRP